MEIIKGHGVCRGIAFGKLNLIKEEKTTIRCTHVKDTKKEFERFLTAKKSAIKQLDELYSKALNEVGEENAQIFDIHRMMLDDADYLNSIQTHILERKLNAESAVSLTSDIFSEIFSNMDDVYMQARAADVKDISDRLISILTNTQNVFTISDESVIIGAHDLAPSETVQLDKSKILAFVTEKGSLNSHTSILARTMNIPAIIGAEGICNPAYDGSEIIADGFTGYIYIDPDMNTIIKMQEKKAEYDSQKKLLKKLKGVKPVTLNGKEIMLYANIGSVEDMAAVYENDAMGVGLFRSEFLYLEANNYPSEDMQFSVYKSIAEKSLGKKVIIRTLDIGADKSIGYFHMPKEENPAMGIRAIRICLSRPSIFKTQLKALYRASAFGNIAIMLPMITTADEVVKTKELCNTIKKELIENNIPFNHELELGIMIETPAAALISDILAKEVDFFSIGTNDLIQYTLAADRQNPNIEAFCDKNHPAILRLIKMVVENAHAEGIWAGVCGELASDLDFTEKLLSFGVDELSVPPGMILPLKQKILMTDINKIN